MESGLVLILRCCCKGNSIGFLIYIDRLDKLRTVMYVLTCTVLQFQCKGRGEVTRFERTHGSVVEHV